MSSNVVTHPGARETDPGGAVEAGPVNPASVQAAEGGSLLSAARREARQAPRTERRGKHSFFPGTVGAGWHPTPAFRCADALKPLFFSRVFLGSFEGHLESSLSRSAESSPSMRFTIPAKSAFRW